MKPDIYGIYKHMHITAVIHVNCPVCFEHFQMTQHNVGALVVVKPGEDKAIAGIVTERGSHYSTHYFDSGELLLVQKHIFTRN